MTDPLGKRALIALLRNHPATERDGRYGWRSMRMALDRRDMLLRWSATMTDYDLLNMRNFGKQSLAWTRAAADALPPMVAPAVSPVGIDTDLLLLIAECLIPMAFAVSPDAGYRQSRLRALRAALAGGPE